MQNGIPIRWTTANSYESRAERSSNFIKIDDLYDANLVDNGDMHYDERDRYSGGKLNLTDDGRKAILDLPK